MNEPGSKEREHHVLSMLSGVVGTHIHCINIIQVQHQRRRRQQLVHLPPLLLSKSEMLIEGIDRVITRGIFLLKELSRSLRQ